MYHFNGNPVYSERVPQVQSSVADVAAVTLCDWVGNGEFVQVLKSSRKF